MIDSLVEQVKQGKVNNSKMAPQYVHTYVGLGAYSLRCSSAAHIRVPRKKCQARIFIVMNFIALLPLMMLKLALAMAASLHTYCTYIHVSGDRKNWRFHFLEFFGECPLKTYWNLKRGDGFSEWDFKMDEEWAACLSSLNQKRCFVYTASIERG